ncbi:MAG: Glycerophosphoryl diester phosphodiesterase, partial [Actinomycetota bacterium]
CDLHLTSDLKLFCWHDDTMDRTSNMTGDVHEMTWETISKATPQPILFKEFMDIAMGAGKDVLIETKHPQKFKGLLEKRLKAELDHLNPTKEWVDQVHARGQEMYVWTVNDPEVAKRLAGWGVDTLISDNPELIANSL